MTAKVEYRPATAADSEDIARFFCMAGSGLYEFLFDDLIPFMTASDVLSMSIGGEDYSISYRNCFVAIDQASGALVGASNAFPTDRLKEETFDLPFVDRQNHVRSMLELQDWGSMFLNVLAVSERCRGLGVGARLLQWAQDCARTAGYDRLSLHVWADNVTAVEFYKARGFVEIGIAPVASHPRLAHTGGSILMRQAIEPVGS